MILLRASQGPTSAHAACLYSPARRVRAPSASSGVSTTALGSRTVPRLLATTSAPSCASSRAPLYHTNSNRRQSRSTQPCVATSVETSAVTAEASNQASILNSSTPSSSTPSSSTPSSSSSSSSSSNSLPPSLAEPVAIIGAGPSGLATAIMLARRGYKSIKVYERMPEPPAPDDLSVWGDFEQTNDRLYMIGLNGRGQKVLRGLDVMERIKQHSSTLAGRMDWRPETPADSPIKILYTNRTYVTHCIQRDRLSSCLLQEVRAKYSDAVSVEFGIDCESAEWGSWEDNKAQCRLTLAHYPQSLSSPDRWSGTYSFVIGADGTGSKLRDSMESELPGKFKVKKFEDTNRLVYRTIPLHWSNLPKFCPADTLNGQGGNATNPPSGEASEGSRAEDTPIQCTWRRDLNFSARTNKGVSIDCLPTPEGPHIGVVLYKPGEERITKLKTKKDAKAFFHKTFPMFVPLLKGADLERFAAKKDSSLPRFSYAGPQLHHGGNTCLVGDTIHTVKPYFGQGVNSAFEDVAVLETALAECNDNVEGAVKRYSELRAKDAEALVELSRTLDGGFFQFLLPLILDSTLNRMLPSLFSPNIIASFQNEEVSFSQVRRRKRIDRAMQAVLVVAALCLLVQLLRFVASLAVRLIGVLGKMLA